MKRRALLLSGCCLSLVGACQASSVDAQQTTTINAVVETVDPISRELLLRGAGGAQSGHLLSVIVGSTRPASRSDPSRGPCQGDVL